MLYTKPIEKITFQDVLDFCSERYKENSNLDYKQEIESSLAKTVVAMANTWGGLIIIGVEDEDSMPKLPVVGLLFREHLQEQVNNIILGNITPPVFPEIQVCKSDEGSHAFVVVRISQSNITPHAMRGATRVYLRTNTSNEPEELATVERVLRLTDRRKKSTDLKESFYKRADERFSRLLKKEGITINHNEVIFSMVPLYPFDTLIRIEELTEGKLVNIKENGWYSYFPINLHRTKYIPAQFGTFSFMSNKETGYASYEDINQFGFFYHREDLARSDKDEEGKVTHLAFLHDILRRLDLFFSSMAKFYEELGYWGILELKINFHKLEEVDFKDLPAPRGYFKFDNILHRSIDETLEFSKQINPKQLKDERVSLVVDLLTEIAWALGFAHVKESDIKKLMEEAGRL